MDTLVTYWQFFSFGLLLSGLWISFRHQVGKPIDNRASVAYIGDGGNPFALKEKYLQHYLIYPGVFVSVVGGILTIVTSLAPKGMSIPSLFVGGAISIGVFLCFGVIVQFAISELAKAAYRAPIMEHQRKVFMNALYALENDGNAPDGKLRELSQEAKEERIGDARETVARVCDLLDVSINVDDSQKIERLKKLYRL